MPGTIVFASGNYRYIPAVFQYSGGVAAEEGYGIERARFVKPLPLAQAFDAVEAPRAPRLSAWSTRWTYAAQCAKCCFENRYQRPQTVLSRNSRTASAETSRWE